MIYWRVRDCLYKFKATIIDILNKYKLWYSSCKKCSKIVKVIKHTISCNNCNSENVEYEMRLESVKSLSTFTNNKRNQF